MVALKPLRIDHGRPEGRRSRVRHAGPRFLRRLEGCGPEARPPLLAWPPGRFMRAYSRMDFIFVYMFFHVFVVLYGIDVVVFLHTRRHFILTA